MPQWVLASGTLFSGTGQVQWPGSTMGQGCEWTWALSPAAPRPGAGVSPDPQPQSHPFWPCFPLPIASLGLPHNNPAGKVWFFMGFNWDRDPGVGCEARERRLLRCWGGTGGQMGQGGHQLVALLGLRLAAAGGSAWKRWGVSMAELWETR